MAFVPLPLCLSLVVDAQAVSLEFPMHRETAAVKFQANPDESSGWIRVEDPPESVPTPVIRLTDNQSAPNGEDQQGVLIYDFWVVDGQPISHELRPPFAWPTPMLVEGDSVTIDLGTKITPGVVETYIFTSVGENGLPTVESLPVPCGPLDDSSSCWITRESSQHSWSIVVNLPAGHDTQFIAVQGSWVIVPDSPLRRQAGRPTLDAAWLFAVERA